MSFGKNSLSNVKFSTIILAAGKGKRVYSKTPKLLLRILGKPIITFVTDLAKAIKSDEIIVVISKGADAMKQVIGKNVKYAIQPLPLGSGDAVKQGIDLVRGNNILVLCGDVPLLAKNTILEILDCHSKKKADLTILTCVVKNPFGYGRIIRNNKNNISGIVEQSDATEKQAKINEINAGVYYGKRELILSALNSITAQNRQGEYYLTDIIKELIKKGKKVIGLKIYNEEEILGINSKLDLSRAREIVKNKWFTDLMTNGVYIEDPLTTNIDLSVRFGFDVHIRPSTIIEGNTVIKDGQILGPFVFIRDGKKIKLNKV